MMHQNGFSLSGVSDQQIKCGINIEQFWGCDIKENRMNVSQ
jgi:hypothetical protein